MQLLKVICVVIPCMLLLLVASTSAVVYDDEEKVITEEEIRYQMKFESERYGCCLVGTLFGGGLSGIAAGAITMGFLEMFPSEKTEGDLGLGYLMFGAMVGEVIGGYFSLKYSWKMGKERDRETAIKRIKEKRRTQKQNEDKESFVPESKITLTLLSGSF